MLTSNERISRILRRQRVDRIGLFEVFWAETAGRWAAQGHLANAAAVEDYFGLDLRRTSGCITPMPTLLSTAADILRGEQVVEETDTTKLVRDANGALLRWAKGSSGAPEHVDFLVKDRAGWERHIKPFLLDRSLREKRINWELYRKWRDHCRLNQLFLSCGVGGAFDLMTPMCGHEHLLVGMALDPQWVFEMTDVYVTLVIELLETLFAKEGLPDGLWVWDDLGFRDRPFMSPSMYRELIFPAHKRLFDFAHARKLPVILHSDGLTEPLVPHLIDAGLDCLQPLEVKAGMDLLKLKKAYGHRLAFIGGLDVRTLITNDLPTVLAELEKKIPGAMAGSGYVLQVDHSVPPQVKYETYRFFVEKGLELGTYK